MINKYNAEKYCSDDISKIENYEYAVNDKSQTWQIHHKFEIQGNFRNSKSMLIKCGLYYKVPAWQLVFLTKSEHLKLHHTGKTISDETKQKMSISNSGFKNPMFGKPSPNKGKKQPLEIKKQVSRLMSGNLYWNNGYINKRAKECPGIEWKRGRIH